MQESTQNINRIESIEFSHRNRHGQKMVKIRCECGNEKVVALYNVRAGRTRSCGCIHAEQLIERNQSGEMPVQTTHGLSHIPEYQIYKAAKGRCQNPNDKSFANYGGRGIEFRFTSFEEFLKDVGFRPSPDLSLDRKNNNGHYEKANLRWATSSQQALNRRSRYRSN